MIYPIERKIIHIDMDCFYAAVEIRDNPALENQPIAVGRAGDQRGVVCTCNYIARGFGVRSAMSINTALGLCPNLITVPVNMAKYQEISKQTREIFYEFTNLVEPLSLDEAYLDVTNSIHCKGSATLIANAIRAKIYKITGLTASAGVAINKFLAKLGSGWNKPNGTFVIHPNDSLKFVSQLPVDKLFGVGKVTAAKLHSLNIKTCNDLQKYDLKNLAARFGKLGITLYNQARGIDNRAVEPNRPRKSLSVEETFSHDLDNLEVLLTTLVKLYEQLQSRLNIEVNNSLIKSVFIKVRFSNFKRTTAERKAICLTYEYFKDLFLNCYTRHEQSVRLLGIGVSFETKPLVIQNELF